MFIYLLNRGHYTHEGNESVTIFLPGRAGPGIGVGVGVMGRDMLKVVVSSIFFRAATYASGLGFRQVLVNMD